MQFNAKVNAMAEQMDWIALDCIGVLINLVASDCMCNIKTVWPITSYDLLKMHFPYRDLAE